MSPNTVPMLGNFREYLRLPAYLRHCAVLQNPGPQRHTRAWSFDYKMQSLQKGTQKCSKYPSLGGGETGQRVRCREVFYAMSPRVFLLRKAPGTEMGYHRFSWAQEVTMEVLVARLLRSSRGRCGLPPPPASSPASHARRPARRARPCPQRRLDGSAVVCTRTPHRSYPGHPARVGSSAGPEAEHA